MKPSKQPPESIQSAGNQRPGRLALFWRQAFIIDPRSLTLFRWLIGACLLWDVSLRMSDPAQVDGLHGLIPHRFLRELSQEWSWSFHLASQSMLYPWFLAILLILSAIGIIIGWRVRGCLLAAWLITLSLHNATWPLLNGGDTLMRMLLFWGMFLPWFQKTAQGGSGINRLAPSMGTLAIMLQMVLVYVCSAVLKSNEDWLSGRALEGCLSNDLYATPIGKALVNWPGCLKILTWATLGLEWVAPLILLFGQPRPTLRLTAVIALVAMHLIIMLTMHVGLFSLVSIAGLSLFLPTRCWDRYAPFMRTPIQVDSRAVTHAPVDQSWAARGRAWICLLALIWISLVNLHGLPGKPLPWLGHASLECLRTGLGLWQRWGMFETIPKLNGWYVAKLTLENGQELDLLDKAEGLSWQRPKNPSGMFPNHRWRKIFREMAHEDAQGYHYFRDPVCRHLLHQWQQANPSGPGVIALDLFFCSTITSVTGDSTLTRRQSLHQIRP